PRSTYRIALSFRAEFRLARRAEPGIWMAWFGILGPLLEGRPALRASTGSPSGADLGRAWVLAAARWQWTPAQGSGAATARARSRLPRTAVRSVAGRRRRPCLENGCS